MGNKTIIIIIQNQVRDIPERRRERQGRRSGGSDRRQDKEEEQ